MSHEVTETFELPNGQWYVAPTVGPKAGQRIGPLFRSQKEADLWARERSNSYSPMEELEAQVEEKLKKHRRGKIERSYKDFHEKLMKHDRNAPKIHENVKNKDRIYSENPALGDQVVHPKVKTRIIKRFDSETKDKMKGQNKSGNAIVPKWRPARYENDDISDNDLVRM